MKRILLIVAGTISLVLGIIGAFLPVLPTTPFILLTLYCYVRSSQRMYAWVMRSRWAGKHVKNVLAGRGIPLSVKVFAIVVSLCMMGYVGIMNDSVRVWAMLGTLFAVQLYFMIRIPTYREPKDLPVEARPEIESSETPVP